MILYSDGSIRVGPPNPLLTRKPRTPAVLDAIRNEVARLAADAQVSKQRAENRALNPLMTPPRNSPGFQPRPETRPRPAHPTYASPSSQIRNQPSSTPNTPSKPHRYYTTPSSPSSSDDIHTIASTLTDFTFDPTRVIKRKIRGLDTADRIVYEGDPEGDSPVHYPFSIKLGAKAAYYFSTHGYTEASVLFLDKTYDDCHLEADPFQFFYQAAVGRGIPSDEVEYLWSLSPLEEVFQ